MVVKTEYCDRCGVQIEYPLRTSFGLLKRKPKFHIKRRTNDYSELDLCQNCYNELENWIYEGKEK